MPEKLSIGDSIAVVLVGALYLVMLGGIAIVMSVKGFADWRAKRWD